jgi:hypothetical protein
MPHGVLGRKEKSQAWVEDLCVYRRGVLILGTVTHELHAYVRLTDFEWERWRAHRGADPA